MHEVVVELPALLSSIRGYLEFSDGTPSPAFQSAVNELFRQMANSHPKPWNAIPSAVLEVDSNDQNRARQVLEFAHDEVLPAYRSHHGDLLAHMHEAELWTPLFLVRAYEATLRESGNETRSLNPSAIVDRLNDFMGHRPLAVLENHRGIQPYPHEKVRPVPLYIRNVGAGTGKYESLILATIEILKAASPGILQDAAMNLDLLDEIAFDPRAYDHSHPVNQRPGYQFGEWDPHCIDNNGHYRRFVLRHLVLDSLHQWIQDSDNQEYALREGAAALAGTMLLASGICGWGPGAISADVNLAQIVPTVAKCRDAFYAQLLQSSKEEFSKPHPDSAQPFGKVRAYLNHRMAAERARQVRQEQLAMIYGKMDRSEAALRVADSIDPPAVRLRARMDAHTREAKRNARRGEFEIALMNLNEAEDLLHRAIECGAMIDPWNILGFGGQFPRFHTAEDAIPDSRIDDLLAVMTDFFETYAVLVRETAAQNNSPLRRNALERMRGLASWWDPFATIEVSGVKRVYGAEAVESAEFVAEALLEWQSAGDQTGNVSFWRERAERFSSPTTFGIVVEALLDQRDWLASMPLMMLWLSQKDQIPLEGPEHRSFKDLAQRWLSEVIGVAQRGEVVSSRIRDSQLQPLELVIRFFDHLEANAGESWTFPEWSDFFGTDETSDVEDPDTHEDTFAAAFEGVVYRDTTDDGIDSNLAGGLGDESGDELSQALNPLTRRIQFITACSRFWIIVARQNWNVPQENSWADKLDAWIEHVHENKSRALSFLDRLSNVNVGRIATANSLGIEYGGKVRIKDSLIARTTQCIIALSHALRTLIAARASRPVPYADPAHLEPWEQAVQALESALLSGDRVSFEALIEGVQDTLNLAPLMYVPTDKGGQAAFICRARYARDVLRVVASLLAQAGEFRLTHDFLVKVLDIEQSQRLRSTVTQVSEFDILFRLAFRSSMDSLTNLIARWKTPDGKEQLASECVRRVLGKFTELWTGYIAGVRISELERRSTKSSWERTREFIKDYGRDVFTQAFLADVNLDGLLHQGVRAYLRQMIDFPSDEEPQLIMHLRDGVIELDEAEDQLDFIVRSVLENYDIYRDYNATTPQSDYGNNLHFLFGFLRTKATFDRARWLLEPAYLAHNALARHGIWDAAHELAKVIQEQTEDTARSLRRSLAYAERVAQFKLPTISAIIHEGFLGPLQLDRILALAERTLDADSEIDRQTAFDDLQIMVDEFGESHAGSGIDIPDWLDLLQSTVQRKLDRRAERDDVPGMVPTALGDITLTQFEEQIKDWPT